VSAELLQAVVTVVAIMNPFGTAPIFQNMVSPLPRPAQRRAALSACVFMLLVLVATAFVGRHLLTLFGITIDAFRAAGGVIVGLTGLDMLRGVSSQRHEQLADEESIREQVLVPFAMPIVAGPGTITAVIALSTVPPPDVIPWTALLAILAGVLVTAACLYGILAFGKYLSRNAQRIFTRFMGLILVAMGMQFLLAGAKVVLGIGQTAAGLPGAPTP
jgi:multiple antibiotic resistance protein